MTHFRIVEDLPKYPNMMDEFENMLFSNGNIILNKNQFCFTDIEPNSLNWSRGVGSLAKDWDQAEDSGNLINVPRRKDRLQESQFKHLIKQAKGTIFEDIYNTISSRYNVGRMRMMRMAPLSVLSWHYDDTDRLHYPAQTYEGCFMAFNDEIKHMEQNTWYMVSTLNEYHTAFNASVLDRYHLVVSIIK